MLTAVRDTVALDDLLGFSRRELPIAKQTPTEPTITDAATQLTRADVLRNHRSPTVVSTIQAVIASALVELLDSVVANSARRMLDALLCIPLHELGLAARNGLILIVVNACFEFNRDTLLSRFIQYYRDNSVIYIGVDPESAMADVLSIEYTTNLLSYVWKLSDETYNTILITVLHWPLHVNIGPVLGNLWYIYSNGLIADSAIDGVSLLRAIDMVMLSKGWANPYVVDFIHVLYSRLTEPVPVPDWVRELDDLTGLDEEEMLYGPLSPPASVPIINDVEWYRQYRMLYEPENWYRGLCNQCHRRILDYRYCVRAPIVFDGWSGCFCSWECVLDWMIPNGDLLARNMVGYYSRILSIAAG